MNTLLSFTRKTLTRIFLIDEKADEMSKKNKGKCSNLLANLLVFSQISFAFIIQLREYSIFNQLLNWPAETPTC